MEQRRLLAADIMSAKDFSCDPDQIISHPSELSLGGLYGEAELTTQQSVAAEAFEIANSLSFGLSNAIPLLLNQYTGHFDQLNQNTPHLIASVSSELDLSVQWQNQIGNIDASNASTMTSLIEELETQGFAIQSAMDDATLGSLDQGSDADYIRVAKQIDYSLSGSISTPSLSIFDEITSLSGIEVQGAVPFNLQGTLNVTLGVDQNGFYFTTETTHIGNLSAMADVAGSAFENVTTLGSVGLQVTSISAPTTSLNKIRLDDLATGISMTGHAEGNTIVEVGFERDLGDLGRIPIDASWEWEFSDSSVATLNLDSSGFETALFEAELLDVISTNLVTLATAIDQSTHNQIDLPLSGTDLSPSFASDVKNGFLESGDLIRQGLTIELIADPSDLIEDASSLDRLLEVRLTNQRNTSSSQQASLERLAGEAEEGQLDIDFSSTVSFDPEVSTDLVLGYDLTGGSYVVEGSNWISELNSNVELAGTTKFGSLIESRVRGTYDLDFRGQLSVVDEDAIPLERFYLSSRDSSDGEPELPLNLVVNADARIDSLVFGLDLSSAPVELPQIEISASTSLDQNSGVISIQFPEDAIISAAGEAIRFGVDELAEQLLDLGTRFESIPHVGNSVADVIGQAFEQHTRTEGSLGNDIQDYFESLGFSFSSTTSAQVEDLFSGSFGSKPLIEMTYTTPDLIGLSEITREGKIQRGPINVSGNLAVTPTIGATYTVGLDAIGGFYLKEGAAFDASVTVDGSLTGTADLGRMENLTADATVDGAFGAIITIDDQDNENSERLYLIGTPDVEATSLRSIVQSDQSDLATNTLTINAIIRMDSPLEQLGLREYLFDDLVEALPDGLKNPLLLSAVIQVDASNGDVTIDVDQRSIDDFLALFGEDAKATFRRAFVRALFKKLSGDTSPIPKSVREVMNFELPIFGRSIKSFLKVDSASDLLLDPDKWEEEHLDDAESNPEETHDWVTFEFDLFEEDNLRDMLLGSDVLNIASVRLVPEYRAEFQEYTLKPETPFISYMGIVNGTYE
ncbi:MAG: hypothetical protein AAF664_21800, partial [Planctomycetota bacterium]